MNEMMRSMLLINKLLQNCSTLHNQTDNLPAQVPRQDTPSEAREKEQDVNLQGYRTRTVSGAAIDER